MTDRPLDPAALEALQSVLTATDPPAVDPQTWHEMLRRAFEAGDDVLSGDASGEDLLPQDWPAPAGDAAVGPVVGEEATDDGAVGDGWSVDGDAWSDHDPAGDGLGGNDNADNDGGDLT